MQDEKGTTVGQLNAVENQYVYKLPIRVVYVVKEGATKEADLQALQAKFAAHQPTLEAYLNKNSFNQALITCSFETPATPLVISFKPEEWAKKGYYDPITDELQHKSSNQEVLTYMRNFIKGNSTFKGITILLTELELKDNNPDKFTYGTGEALPSNLSNLIMYKQGVLGTREYAHEIGHILGLRHTFLNKKTLENIPNVNKSISESTEKLDDHNKTLATMRKKLKIFTKGSNDYNEQEKNIGIQLISIKNRSEFLERLKGERESYRGNILCYKESKSENIMDYFNTSHSLFHWQYITMLNDLLKFHGNKIERK